MHPPRAVRSSASGPHFDAPILVAGACVERRLSSRTFRARSLYPSRMHSASASRPSKSPFAFPIFTSSLLLWCHIMLRILFFALLLIVLAFRTVRRNCGFQPPPRRAPIVGHLFPSCLYVYPSCIDFFFSAFFMLGCNHSSRLMTFSAPAALPLLSQLASVLSRWRKKNGCFAIWPSVTGVKRSGMSREK